MITYTVKENDFPYPKTKDIFSTSNKQEAIKIMEEVNGRWTVVYVDGVPIGAME